jgi:lipopolysaccharide export LptBFGC system permease protein LptF
MILTITILVLFIVPVYVLWKLSRGSESGNTIGVIIGVLLVFTLVFSAVLSLFTLAKRHEILAAAAA